MMRKLPCGFLSVREALPYVATEVTGLMGQKCVVTCSHQHQELQFRQVPREMHTKNYSLHQLLILLNM